MLWICIKFAISATPAGIKKNGRCASKKSAVSSTEDNGSICNCKAQNNKIIPTSEPGNGK